MANENIYQSIFTGAQMDERLTAVATLQAALANFYTKEEVDDMLASVQSQEYETASELPTASAQTMGKIYLIGPDASNYYAYYFTSFDGSDYSWVGPLGTTQITLADYPTKAELAQMITKVAETGFFVVDENLYVGMKVDNDGVHAKNVFTTEIISQ